MTTGYICSRDRSAPLLQGWLRDELSLIDFERSPEHVLERLVRLHHDRQALAGETPLVVLGFPTIESLSLAGIEASSGRSERVATHVAHTYL